MYYNYHAKVKKLIKTGELIDYQLLPVYNNISPCLLLIFKNHPPMPIREYRFSEYFDLLSELNLLK